MSKRGKRKSQIQSILDIDVLAKMCLAYLPWLQYRQWILENDDKQQTKLIRLRLKECSECQRILEDVICKDNIKAFELLLPYLKDSTWSFLTRRGTPHMLQFALTHAPRNPRYEAFDPMNCPFANFKLICQAQTDVVPLLKIGMINEQQLQCLDWMLNVTQWHASVETVEEWSPRLWSIFEPAIVSKRVSFLDETVLPIQYWQSISFSEDRRKTLSIERNEWEKAAFFLDAVF